MRRSLLAVLLTAVLGIMSQTWAAQADFEFEACVPRVLSLHSPGASGVPPVDISFHYDSKGKLLVSPGAMVGDEQVSGSATLGKLVSGERAFTLSAKALTTKGVSIVVKAQLGQATATCTYRAPSGAVTVPDLPVRLEFASPVTTGFSLVSQIDAGGRITGTGRIVSGFENDSSAGAVLTGTSNKTSLKWQLKQGTQRLSFIGKKAPNGFLGNLVASIPPASSTYKNFLFPGFQTQLRPELTRFRGSVSQAALGEFPSPAAGATVSVSSDLDRNGTTETHERFETEADSEGRYSLDCPIADGGRALLRISMEGCAPQLEVLEPVRLGADLVNNITLRPLAEMTFLETVAKTEDGKLELVDLPQHVVSIQARVFNPAVEAEQFPGEFADDRGSLLISSVFSAIEARDGAGDEVDELGSGTLLRMQVPKDTWGTLRDLRSGTGQIDCPLYYYDETSGEWKRSAEDGWLETSQGVIIPEIQLPLIRQGSYGGNVYVAGPITHLSYWNLDWPVESHACIQGVVVDDSGQPVSGAAVDIRGVTYTGSTSGQVTGADGRFCAEVMRSEAMGEDVDGNGIPGESQQVSIAVSYADQLYSFGPFNAPVSAATCDDGGCQDVGSLRLASANRLKLELVTLSGTARFGDNNAPVPNAWMFAFDETLEADVFMQFLTNPAVRFTATTDANGAFSLTIPCVAGPTLFLSYNTGLGTNTLEMGSAVYQVAGSASAPILLQVERYRTSAVFDTTGLQVGSIFEYGAEVSGYLTLSVGNTYFWAVPPDDEDSRLPRIPGTTTSWDLHAVEGPTEVVGSVIFTATTPIGGTWRATGLSWSGTWGN